MNSKEIFALFLRIVGVLGVLIIIRHVLASVPTCSPSLYQLIKWGVGGLVGLYLIRGAPLGVKFAYPAKHWICEP